MVKITDSKTIKGRILKIGHSRCYYSDWGEVVFKGKEVIVCVKQRKRKQKIPMYIRDDSLLGLMLPIPDTLKNKTWELSIHGEALLSGRGTIFIDRIFPLSNLPKQVSINNYFEY